MYNASAKNLYLLKVFFFNKIGNFIQTNQFLPHFQIWSALYRLVNSQNPSYLVLVWELSSVSQRTLPERRMVVMLMLASGLLALTSRNKASMKPIKANWPALGNSFVTAESRQRMLGMNSYSWFLLMAEIIFSAAASGFV